MKMKKKKTSIITIITILVLVFTMAAPAYADAAVFRYASKVESALFSTDNLKGYTEPDTPSFSSKLGFNTFMSSKSRIKYVRQLCEENPYLHLFFDEKNDDIPVVIFTDEDISQAGDLYEACSMIADQEEKINVFYHGQLHGDEPAGGEGALYFLSRLTGDYAESLAPELNMCVVPCANPKAATEMVRARKEDCNLNADNLASQSIITQMLHQIYNSFSPEVVVDSHECVSNMQLGPNKTSDYFTDVYITCTSSLNIDSRINDWSEKFRDKALKDCRNAGLRVSIYDNYTTLVNNVASRNYYGLRGSISLVVESMGINMGKSHFERRTFSHAKAVESILATAIANKVEIKETLAAAESDLIKKGSRFSTENRVVLKHGISKKKYTTVKRSVFSSSTGKKLSQVNYKVYKHDKIVRSRALPTAYVISKKTAGAEDIMKRLQFSGVEYYQLEPGIKLKVSQFSGDGEKAKIISGRNLKFSKGAYIIPMDQPSARVIAACLEPDIAESYNLKGTFVQAELLKASQIYRYTGSNPREKFGLGPQEEESEEVTEETVTEELPAQPEVPET